MSESGSSSSLPSEHICPQMDIDPSQGTPKVELNEYGHAAQIIRVEPKSGKAGFALSQHVLEQILMKREIRDLPAVVVSVAGAYRSGKSFLLNYFLRYLKSSSDSRLDGSWLGGETEPLTGFEWTKGPEITTRGIFMWSEPFVITQPSGDKVAVLLVDTEGLFHNDYKYHQGYVQSSGIFKLSSLISSVQIFNVVHYITDDQLHFLQDCTDGNASVSTEKDSKSYQSLQFLIRDWQFSFDIPYGSVGGKRLLEQKFQITPDQPKDLTELRENIRSRFKDITCFLMPHPILKQSEKDLHGNISGLNADFKIHLIDFVTSLLSPEKLVPKKINGTLITVRDLFFYINIYTNMLNSSTASNPMTISEATNKAFLLSEVDIVTIIYERGMSSECGPTQPSMPAVDVEHLHKKHSVIAHDYFTNKKPNVTGKEDWSVKKLIKNLERRKTMFLRCNEFKTKIATSKGMSYYDVELKEMFDTEELCLHPNDLDNLHERCLKVAISTFDAVRKRVTNEVDVDRTKFIESFEKNHELLKQINNRNNMLAVMEANFQYYEDITNARLSSPMSDEEILKKHEAASRTAFDHLDRKRTRYTEDFYKTTLTQRLTGAFNNFCQWNKSLAKEEELKKKYGHDV